MAQRRAVTRRMQSFRLAHPVFWVSACALSCGDLSRSDLSISEVRSRVMRLSAKQLRENSRFSTIGAFEHPMFATVLSCIDEQVVRDCLDFSRLSDRKQRAVSRFFALRKLRAERRTSDSAQKQHKSI
jgi:hypothetical protein